MKHINFIRLSDGYRRDIFGIGFDPLNITSFNTTIIKYMLATNEIY